MLGMFEFSNILIAIFSDTERSIEFLHDFQTTLVLNSWHRD